MIASRCCCCSAVGGRSVPFRRPVRPEGWRRRRRHRWAAGGGAAGSASSGSVGRMRSTSRFSVGASSRRVRTETLVANSFCSALTAWVMNSESKPISRKFASGVRTARVDAGQPDEHRPQPAQQGGGPVAGRCGWPPGRKPAPGGIGGLRRDCLGSADGNRVPSGSGRPSAAAAGTDTSAAARGVAQRRETGASRCRRCAPTVARPRRGGDRCPRSSPGQGSATSRPAVSRASVAGVPRRRDRLRPADPRLRRARNARPGVPRHHARTATARLAQLTGPVARIGRLVVGDRLSGQADVQRRSGARRGVAATIAANGSTTWSIIGEWWREACSRRCGMPVVSSLVVNALIAASVPDTTVRFRRVERRDRYVGWQFGGHHVRRGTHREHRAGRCGLHPRGARRASASSRSNVPLMQAATYSLMLCLIIASGARPRHPESCASANLTVNSAAGDGGLSQRGARGPGSDLSG